VENGKMKPKKSRKKDKELMKVEKEEDLIPLVTLLVQC